MVDVGELPGPCERCRMRPICETSDRWCAQCSDEVIHFSASRCKLCGGAKQLDRAALPLCEVCERASAAKPLPARHVLIDANLHEAREQALHGFAAAALTLFGACALLITSDRQARAFANLTEPLLSNGVRLGLFTQIEASAFRLALNIERPEP